MLTDLQFERLKACARVLAPPARIVVAGGTAAAVAALEAGALPGVHVIAVEPTALNEVEGPIDVLFISRAGRYSAAVEAFERWSSRVVPGGTMFVHGAFAATPLTAALLRTIGPSPAWRYFGRDGALAEYTRADLARGERLLDAIAQAAQLPAFARTAAGRRVRRLRSS